MSAPFKLEREGTAASEVPLESDALLVRRLQQGASGATTELFDRHGSFVLRVITRLLGSSEPECADLLHEVFIRAWARVSSVHDARSLKPWLARIAVLVAQEWLRRRKRHGAPVSGDEAAEREGPSAASAEVREAVRSLYAMLERFPEEERTAFVLRQLEGMTLQELADACGVSMSTARRRFDGAEQRFRELLPEYPALSERATAERSRT
jgi:RNA polymerase sigma-70 factor (ECF subfamily)